MQRQQAKPRSVLAEPYVVDVILFLSEKGQVMATELLEVISSYRTSKGLLDRLSSTGLVNIEVVNRPRVTFKIKLTPKGKKVAEKLREAIHPAERKNLAGGGPRKWSTVVVHRRTGGDTVGV